MEQETVWLIVGLFAVSIPLVALAKRAGIPYPIVLVVGGLVLGFIPGLPNVAMDPNLVLVIFLPPLLYWEGITAPIDVMRANWGQIWVLAVGLVIATTVVVAVVAHASITGITWAMAFVLGAIVAPTDELASAPILERLGMPRHLIAIVEGESLLNDASSLILYVVAVALAIGGTFNLTSAAITFIASALGGILVGLLVGRLAVAGWRRVNDPQIESIISVTTPYLSYSLAQRFGVSGVLAVVYTAIHVSQMAAKTISPSWRLSGAAFWNTAVFLINVVLFVTLGVQLHGIATAVFAEYSVAQALWYAFIVNVTVIGVRFAWILAEEYLPVIGASSEHPSGDWKHAIVAAWSGLRGAVSLAAALALPLTVASGAPLPFRNLVIFLTFSVIVVTLVAGGLSLPWLIRMLKVPAGDDEEAGELRRGVVAMAQAALAELAAIEEEGVVPADQIARLRRRYEHQREHVDGHPPQEEAIVDAEQRILDRERDALADLRERGEIDNAVARRLLLQIDLAEARLTSLDARFLEPRRPASRR